MGPTRPSRSFISLGSDCALNHLYVTVIFRDLEKLESMPWVDQVDGIMCDLYENFSPLVSKLKAEDTLVHLAWKGLPNFKEAFHLTENLPRELDFLHAALEKGLKHLMVTGTCYEYGLQNGALAVDLETNPIFAYPLAKDVLRKALEIFTVQYDVAFQWVRLFYMYGEGQNPKSLYPLVQAALARGDKEFAMSGGEQLRDYMKVEDLAAFLTTVIEDKTRTGIINCCSGTPISVRRLVESWVQGRMELKLGVYPYPDYEPMAFWGRP